MLERSKYDYNLKFLPIPPRYFLLDKEYLGKGDEAYPIVADEFEKMNSGKYIEVLLTGAIGTAKTTLALWTNAYQLYLLSAYKNPQRQFNIDSSSEILFIFQSLNKSLARDLDFERFKSLIENSPYFASKFPFDKDKTSELDFPNRIIVKPVSGAATGAIGQNVFGGLMDEVNYMAVVEKSKMSVGQGTYNQAIELYNAIARRRKSRFMKLGKVPGLFCIVSSKRYPGQFTDQKEEEARNEIKKTGKTTIYVYDKRTWDVLPKDRFSGKWFTVFTGDEHRRPRILKEDEVLVDENPQYLLEVPEDYRVEFEKDIINALREIGGISTLARFPFFPNREEVAAMFGSTQSILSVKSCDFVETKLSILPNRFYKPELPRWVHMDLSISGDCTGLACGTVVGFKEITRAGEDVEMAPILHYDFILQVHAPKGGEILYYKLRSLLYRLRELGMNMKWVSFDSFQSTDSIQILRQKGFVTGQLSMDTSTMPYQILKSAAYDYRVVAPKHEICELELLSLEKDAAKDKVDHPPTGSKDCSDSMAGVAYGLSTRREIYAMYDVPIITMPLSLREKMDNAKDKMKAENPDLMEEEIEAKMPKPTLEPVIMD